MNLEKIRQGWHTSVMLKRYFLIRIMDTKEPIGIAEVNTLRWPVVVFQCLSIHSAGAYRISQSEYETYQAFELLPEFDHNINNGYLQIYDPKDFLIIGCRVHAKASKTWKSLNTT